MQHIMWYVVRIAESSTIGIYPEPSAWQNMQKWILVFIAGSVEILLIQNMETRGGHFAANDVQKNFIRGQPKTDGQPKGPGPHDGSHRQQKTGPKWGFGGGQDY